MNSKLILGIVVIIVVGALGWFFYSTRSIKSDQPAATTTNEESTATSSTTRATTGESTLTYNESGFEPQSLTVKSGESLTWVNNSSRNVQVGSALHPTHTVNQEITGNDFVIELAPGESTKVQLTKIGEWGYHDHLRPSITGKIIVQ